MEIVASAYVHAGTRIAGCKLQAAEFRLQSDGASTLAMSDSPPARGCLFQLLVGITALCAVLGLLVVLAAVQHARWEASKLTRVRDAVAKMKSEGGHRLGLYSARNIDAQLEQIRGMPDIETIYLDGTDLTAVGMQHIGTLPNLKSFLAYEAVGDAGLLALRNCKLLESVAIYDRSITPEAIAELQSHLPNVSIGTRHDEALRDRDGPVDRKQELEAVIPESITTPSN